MLYIVLKISEDENVKGEVIAIKSSHLEAHEVLLSMIEDDKNENDVVNIVNKNRVEVYKFQSGWVKSYKQRTFIFIIQEFLDE
ncbi:hypothetical protein LCGC14_2612530 [marine sediment metagenome]|uniref:Uncharacterized protein n=1 Tax=marine sediment metagenome TaxID=412755 RepID=A0A0F9A5P9_9ZZZZ